MSSEPEEDGPDLPVPDGGPEPHRCDVVVLGASFAGIEVLLQLQRRAERPLKMVVVDRQAQHGYIPLVHEGLCGRLSASETTLDTEAFVQSLPGVRMMIGEVVSFDPKDKLVTLASGDRVQGRFVVVALGSVLEPPPSIPGARHLLRYKGAEHFERARERLGEVLGEGADEPHLVVVGGGISGVELAGELAHLRTRRPEGWRSPAVSLVTGGEQLLPELGPTVGNTAMAALRDQGVTLRLGTRVVEAGPDEVVLRRGEHTERLSCAAALWAGGVRPAPVLADLGLPCTDEGWLAVGPTLQCFPTSVPTKPDVFACGDAVRVIGGTGEWNTMQRAIECLWQAKVVARNVVALAGHAPDYPEGVPPLRPHVLRERFAYGVSLGARSLVVYGPARVDLRGFNVWFRRWLMRQYFARYAPRSD